MTTLEDILRDLSYGELAQLKIGNLLPEEFESAPDPKSYAQILSHINLGLKELYKRFLLARKELEIIQYPDNFATYLLDNKYALGNVASAEPIKFINDTVALPFENDLLKIEECWYVNADAEDKLLFMNDPTEEDSVYTPTYRSLLLPEDNEFGNVTIKYRASHPKLVYSTAMDPADVDIELPDALHEALLFYVASRAFASLNTDQGTEGNDYWQKFQNSCNEVKAEGLWIQPESNNNRFDDKGWV